MIGRKLAHYELVEKIGSGGMGEVYRARDTKLDRDVALKILPKDMAADPERRKRFEREAKAIASLNHPNIVTIHSVDEADGEHFITMELVEGTTLSQLIPPNGFDLDRFFKVSIPLADAVSAAHQKGVTHRDLKPANVMVDEGGTVKVLDFGLAKLAAPDPDSDKTVGPDSDTREGVVLGTVAYMSPEQAEGKAVDSRSDVFSLGVMLYEMATGDRPFKGDTNISMISSILRDEPKPITDVNHRLPRHAGRIVKRCIAKQPDRRYQSVLDLRNELEELKEEISTGETEVLEGLPGSPRGGRPRWLFPVLGAAVLAIVAIAFFMGRMGDGGGDELVAPASAIKAVDMELLTNNGHSDEAAISPDGKYVCYRFEKDGRQSLWVRQVATGSAVEIVPATDAGLWDPVFTHDGNFIYYIKNEPGAQKPTLYRIPVLGGTPRRISEDVSQRVSFSPDGTQITFLRNRANSSSLVIADADGSNERVLASRAFPEPYQNDPAWSPDGKYVAATVQNLRGGVEAHVYVVSVEDGTETRVPSRPFFGLGELTWLPDGSGILTGAGEGPLDTQIYEISFPDGKVRRITHDLSRYHGVGLTADGRTMVTQQNEASFNLWTVDAAGGSATQITSRNRMFLFGGDWTPDGRIVTSWNAGGYMDIWIMDADGSNPTQMTNEEAIDGQPAVAPDGQTIFFASTRAGSVNLWKMRIDGSSPVQVTNGGFEMQPQVSPDGLWLLYLGIEENGIGTQLFRMAIAGGEPEKLSDIQMNTHAISPDGSRTAFQGFDDASGRWKIHIMDLETREIVEKIDIRHGQYCWSPDGSAITFSRVDKGVANIWNYRLDDGEETKITNFDRDFIGFFRWSPDGKTLMLERGNNSSDIVLVKDFR